jgi:hypothetical protein
MFQEERVVEASDRFMELGTALFAFFLLLLRYVRADLTAAWNRPPQSLFTFSAH